MKGVGKAPSSSEEGVGGGGLQRVTLLKRAAEMRSKPTEPERRLWIAPRDSRLAGYKFRRQTVIGRRIVDFFCPARGLVIEIDGSTHDRKSDLWRDELLARTTGFATLRFTNEEVMHNMDGVLTAVLIALEERPERWGNRRSTTPQPPPLKRRGGKKCTAEAHSSEEAGVGGGGL